MTEREISQFILATQIVTVILFSGLLWIQARRNRRKATVPLTYQPKQLGIYHAKGIHGPGSLKIIKPGINTIQVEGKTYTILGVDLTKQIIYYDAGKPKAP